jgi:hypothetical protein
MNQPLTPTASSVGCFAQRAAAQSAEATRTVKVLCLFALLGLAISAAVLPHVATADHGWVLAHLE